ncbi:MAG TPA: sigma-54 dependent transcriptional regulator, partial [Pirellulales bacterium]
MSRLLVVDDEPTICWGLSRLAQGLGHEVATASSAEQAFERLGAFSPDVVMLDVRLPGLDGLSAMPKLRAKIGDAPIVVMTAYGDLSTAVEAVRNGAFEYLVKPFDLSVAERVLERALAAPSQAKEAAIAATTAGNDIRAQIIGQSAPMQEVFKRIALVAPSQACVHLHGESGTGKELVARAIHRYSSRSKGPFVALNLAALSPTVAESELFGHVRGAFTGADHARRGLLEQAHGGTIFLDEVADIPTSLQVKLLRALDYGEILPVGGDRPVFADFRVVSATHQDLAERTGSGAFRHDLFYRLATFQIHLPPLRERPEDIEELAEYFASSLAQKNGLARPTFSIRAAAELKRRTWRGNVRELRNAVEHALILARGGVIEPDHLPAEIRSVEPAPTATDDVSTIRKLVRTWTERRLEVHGEDGHLHEELLALVEPPCLAAALARCHDQVAAAARRLGLH